MATTYELIASNTVGSGGASSVTFSSIPQTYTDLKVVFSLRSSNAAVDDATFLRFGSNSSIDTGSNYSYKYLRGNGSSASSGSSSPQTFIYVGQGVANNATSNTFGNGEIYISNYTSSNYKSVSVDCVGENSGTLDYDSMIAGLWSNTSAVYQIYLYPENGPTFTQYSTFYLYGIKNS